MTMTISPKSMVESLSKVLLWTSRVWSLDLSSMVESFLKVFPSTTRSNAGMFLPSTWAVDLVGLALPFWAGLHEVRSFPNILQHWSLTSSVHPLDSSHLHQLAVGGQNCGSSDGFFLKRGQHFMASACCYLFLTFPASISLLQNEPFLHVATSTGIGIFVLFFINKLY